MQGSLPPVKLLAFSGSTREGSFNQKLIETTIGISRSAGAEVTMVKLRDLALPLYDQDLQQQGFPESAITFKRLLREHHGFLIASPEHNGSITAALKNALDWASRSEREGEPANAVFRSKTALLLSSSPGALGGMRGLRHLREILTVVGSFTYPDQFVLPGAHEAFGADGSLKDPKKLLSLTDLCAKFVTFTAKLST